MIEKANDGWFRLALDHGFLGDDREFLLGVNHADDDSVPVLRWARVRLVEEWDIMGAGVATGMLGSAAGFPEFAMLSLDGSVILRGTTWQEFIGSLVVPDPHRVQIIRDYVARRSASPRTPAAERAEGEAWLRAFPRSKHPNRSDTSVGASAAARSWIRTRRSTRPPSGPATTGRRRRAEA
ncbi:hypothetical protein [Streptomyces sp. NPDC001507]|uniref:hypothetical protein n=1 Tax=Streptomyces sp. NPDC001507 TaxID=3364579 RepID=UPI0036A6D235